MKNQGTIQDVKVGLPEFQAVAKKVEDKLPQIQDILREVRREQEMQQLRAKMSGPDLNLIERAEASAKELEEQISKRAAYELANDQIEELDQIIGRHGRWSNRWLCALVLVSFIALRLVIWLVAFEDKLFFLAGPVYPQMHCDMNSGVAFYYGVGKLLIASFAIGVLLISTRMYQTHGHNLVVNEQRKLAFIAFRKMLASLPANTDAGGREQLIRTAAQSIFDHGSSGFLPKGTNEFMPLVSAFMDSSKAAKGSSP